MKDVIVWELRRRRTAILWWTFGSVLLSVAIVALYPSIKHQADQLNQVINQLPDGLRQLKSGGTASVNVADPAAFLNSQLYYVTLPILWIILAITRGSGILGKEEQSRTLELLLARPMSRTQLVLAKLAALVLELLIVGGVSLAAIVVLAPVFQLHMGASALFWTTLYTILFSLSFGVIAFGLQAASALTKRGALAVAVAASFGGYLVASLSGLTDWLKTPAKFLPYHYFTPLDPLAGKTPRGLAIYLVGCFAVFAVLAVVGFRKRDIE